MTSQAPRRSSGCRAAGLAILRRRKPERGTSHAESRRHGRQPARAPAGTLPGKFGLVVTRLEEQRLDAEVTIEPWMLAPNGYLHAASILLLADTAAGYACHGASSRGGEELHHHRAEEQLPRHVREGTMRTECRAEHLGRTTQVWSATVFGPDDRKLALFRCTQMVLS